MSYFTFEQRCVDCGCKWPASFGVVGAVFIGESLKVCPQCGSKNLKNASALSEVSTVPYITVHPFPNTAVYQPRIPDSRDERIKDLEAQLDTANDRARNAEDARIRIQWDLDTANAQLLECLEKQKDNRDSNTKL